MSRLWQPRPSRALSAAVVWPPLLHPLGGVPSMGAGVMQQGPHLRRPAGEDRQLCLGVALVDLDLGMVQIGVEVIGLGIGVFPGILGHLEELMFAVAICWCNMPHISSYVEIGRNPFSLG